MAGTLSTTASLHRLVLALQQRPLLVNGLAGKQNRTLNISNLLRQCSSALCGSNILKSRSQGSRTVQKNRSFVSCNHLQSVLKYKTGSRHSSHHASSSLSSHSSIFHSNNAASPCPHAPHRTVVLNNPHCDSHHRTYHKVSQLERKSTLPNHSLLNDHLLLKTARNSFQCSQHQSKAFSIARSILESSPSPWQPYLRLMRFDKPIGTWLLYWPCTWSIAMAAQPGCLPNFKMLALFGAGAFFMRSAGCIINDMWDKDFDSKVARTKERPLACGELTYFQALTFLGAQLSISLAILLQLNWNTVILGASSMGLVIAYPLAKRYTYWPQLVLGFTFNYGALVGWSAVQGSVDWSVCLPLYMSCILWTLVYDTIYAHQDKFDDMLVGVKSTALRLGDQTKPWLTGFTALMGGGLAGSGILLDMPWPYYAGVALTSARLLQQIYTVNLDDADQCGRAFRGNFYLGVVMFACIVMANLMKPEQQKKSLEAEEAES